MLLSPSPPPKFLRDTKSIFCYQVQFFYFFLPLDVSDNKPGVDGRG